VLAAIAKMPSALKWAASEFQAAQQATTPPFGT